MRFLVLGLLLAACKLPQEPPTRVFKARGMDGAWDVERRGSRVRVAGTGDEATIEWRGRTFLFRNVPEFKGYVGDADMKLRAGSLDITFTETELVIGRRGSKPRRWALAELPAGRTIVWDGDLTWRGG